jgi:GT2 family glycosyltransferase
MPARSPKIVIVLLNWNKKKDTLACLQSLQKVSYPHFQTVVVDLASTTDSVRSLRTLYPEMPILESRADVGAPAGNNLGMEWALRHHAEWILFLSNDLIVDPDLLNAFINVAQEEPKAAIIGAKVLRDDQPDTIDYLGSFWDAKTATFIDSDRGEKDHPYFNRHPVDSVCEGAFFMHRSVPEKIGLFDEKFFLFWGEADYCYRAKRARFESWIAPEAKVWRKTSRYGEPLHSPYFWWRSRLLWIERHCSSIEKKELYRRVIFPEMIKMGKDYIRESVIHFFCPSEERKAKAHLLKAGCFGSLDFFRKRFANTLRN